jgi:hypothetical protein
MQITICSKTPNIHPTRYATHLSHCFLINRTQQTIPLLSVLKNTVFYVATPESLSIHYIFHPELSMLNISLENIKLRCSISIILHTYNTLLVHFECPCLTSSDMVCRCLQRSTAWIGMDSRKVIGNISRWRGSRYLLCHLDGYAKS